MQTKRTESLVKRYPVDLAELKRLLLDLEMTRFDAGVQLGIPVHAVDAHCLANSIRAGRRKTVSRMTNAELAVLHQRIRELVDRGLSCGEIATELQVSPKRASELCCNLGLHAGKKGPKSGPDHPDWNGGRVIDKDGYVLLYMPGHHLARKSPGRTPTYVAEHRFVMENHLGRPLLDSEVVHHKDKNKQNNQIENLELFESNAIHLRHELTGHCPAWTEDGLERIRNGYKKLAANRMALKQGAPQKPEE